jgi:hypothetical protein
MGYLYEACDKISDTSCLPTLLVHWTYMHIFRHIFLSNYWWQRSDIWSQASYRYPISWEAFLDPSDSYFLFADFVVYFFYILNKMNCELMLTYDTPALRQTGSRNLTGQKTLPTIWGTYMKLVTKYQISAINSCWETVTIIQNYMKTSLYMYLF